jgi:hypothetical protein
MVRAGTEAAVAAVANGTAVAAVAKGTVVAAVAKGNELNETSRLA